MFLFAPFLFVVQKKMKNKNVNNCQKFYSALFFNVFLIIKFAITDDRIRNAKRMIKGIQAVFQHPLKVGSTVS